MRRLGTQSKAQAGVPSNANMADERTRAASMFSHRHHRRTRRGGKGGTLQSPAGLLPRRGRLEHAGLAGTGGRDIEFLFTKGDVDMKLAQHIHPDGKFGNARIVLWARLPSVGPLSRLRTMELV